MQVWAIVPLKPFVRAKSRLCRVLAAQERQALAEAMFRHSLVTLLDTPEIERISVLSRDTGALAIAREYQVHTIQECGTPYLNDSLERASETLRLQGCDGILVLAADLPLICPEDIRQLIDLGRYLMSVVAAPDRNNDDTNALLVRPPGLINFSFGAGSFRRHVALARKAGATVHVYRSAGTGLDIDTPCDLERYREQIGEEAYRQLLHNSGAMLDREPAMAKRHDEEEPTLERITRQRRMSRHSKILVNPWRSEGKTSRHEQ